ncbi:ABC transporter ATP-binding protein [Streptomyces maremycinicus]|uniref:ABC transporter ATP-binding protein n=1 Tax=Streptomyces maremycinicus TaxID=1679753 RepID=UPI0007875064|nr:ATP-binding cassette domain-containing protein [Streptomyces sp. NBRC 110468]
MDGVGVTADGFGLRGPRGWAFRGVGVDAEPGSLIAVEGPSGSGRTSLLLALTGRMKATEGTATVGGARLPKHLSAVRRVAALAHVAGVTDLEPALTVGEHLRERALLERRFGGPVRELLRSRASRAAEVGLRIDTALAAAGLDREALPKGSRTAVRDLERLEALRLSVALALIGRPRLLAVDDIDLKLTEAEREEVWALLRSLAAAGTTVLAVCGEAPEGTIAVSTGRRTTPPDRETPTEARDRKTATDSPDDAAEAAGSEQGTEAATEAEHGDGTEQGTETGAERGPEAGEQQGPEAGAQRETQAGEQQGPEAGAQRETEAGEQQGPEAVGDEQEREEEKADAIAESGRA